MATDVQIRFKAQSAEAQREIQKLKQEVTALRGQLGQTHRSATEASAGVDKLGDEAREAAIGVSSLGRSIFKTRAEAKKFGGVFLDTRGRIRESNGDFAKTRETIDRLGDEARGTAREVDRLGDALARSGGGVTGFTRATDGASRGSKIFTRALGGVGRVLGELGITSAVHLLGQFATGSVRAAGELQQYIRATEQITGSAEAAEVRLAALIEVANLPGLNFAALTRFSNRLIAAGLSAADTDKILLTVGQTVVSLGGSAGKAALAMEQIIQAIQLGTVDMRDFRTIVQQIPGFLEVLGDVHGVAANLDGLHDAFDRVGGNMRELLIPTFDELAKRYESPPPDSYIVSVDRLQNSFFLLQATLGDKVLPAVSATARGLAGLFDGVRDFLDDGRPTQAANAFAKGLENINSAASRQQALEDRVQALRRLELALKAERSGLDQSSDEYLDLSKQIQAAQVEQDRWNTVLERSPKAAALLESEIAELNARFETLRERLEQTDGTRTAASLAQTQRQFEEVSTSLSVANKLLADVASGFEDTADATDATTAALRPAISSTRDFGGALNQIDTRFLTFHERVAAFQGTIRELPPEIAAVRQGFDVLAPTVARVEAVFAGLQTSLVDTAAEALAFRNVYSLLSHELTSFAADQAIATAEINLVNPAISDTVGSLRDYNAVMRDTGVNFETVEDISNRLTDSIRDQASGFGEVSSASETAGIDISDALDRLDSEVVAVATEVDVLGDAFRSLGDASGDVLDQLIGEFSQLDGVVGQLGTKIGQFDIAGLASGNPNAIATLPFQLYNAFTFDQRQADARRPELDRQNRASSERGEFGIPTDLLAFGRGQLDTAAEAAGRSGFGGRSLLELLDTLDPQIGRTTLDEVATIPDRIIETIQTFTDQILTGLRDTLAQATFDLDFARQTGGDVEGALQDVIDANTALYQTQIDAYNLQRQATGRAVGNVEELNRILNSLNNDIRLQLADGPQNAQQFLAQNNITRGLTAPTDDQERGVVFDAEGAETATPTASVADDVLANALRRTQDAIAAINTAIAGFDARIAQSNDPDAIASLLEQIAEQMSEGFRLRREALQQQLDAGEITREALNTGIAQLNIDESAALEQNADAHLANALVINQQQIDAISVGISELESRLAQSNDPAEIQTLLSQIAEQIPEIYRLRQNALSQQYAAGEITRAAFNTELANLNIEQSAAVEQNSDAQLSNTLRVNQEAIDAISVGVSELESRLAQSNDPAEIQTLLSQIAEQIPEIYRLRRNALSAQYAAGEITLDAINTGIAALNIEQSAAIEQNSDAQLANTLRIHQQDVASIHTQISGLENAISQSNDPAEIASLLIQIAEQIPEIYRLRRAALQQQYDAGEITLSALNTGIAELNIAESAAIEQNSDAQLANLFADHTADIQLIANTVDIVSEALRNANDPAEIVRLLVDIRAAIMEKYLLQREFLQAQLDAEELTVKQYQARIGRLNIQESTALGGADSLAQTQTQRIADTAQRAADAAQRGAQTSQRGAGGGAQAQAAQAAQRAADEALANALRANQDAQDTINVEITALENAISQSNDPAEIARLLMQIAVQIPGIYTLRKAALQTQYDAGKLTQLGLENGIAALNIEASARIEQNSDAQLTNALRINQQATDAVATEIAVLENAITQSNDPAEIEGLLQQISAQIPEIYRLRKDALQKQFDAGEITLSTLNTGIAELNIEASAALEQNSDAQLANALRANQEATTALSVGILLLENAISQSNDPAEIASLLIQIAEQIPEIYRLRREALQAQFDAGEITLAALNSGIAQLNIDASVAIERNSDAQLASAISQHNVDIETINTATGVLQDQIRNSDDPAEISQLTIDLREAILQKYAVQRQILQAQLDAEEVTIAQFGAQLSGLNVQESRALAGADTLAGAETDTLARTTNNLLQNAIQRAEFRVSGATSEQDFETRRQALITAINEFYDAEAHRISQLSLSEAALQNLREDNTLARQQAIGRVMTTENRFTTERIRAEETAHAEIERIRDDAIEREARRQQEIQDLKDAALEAEKDRQEARVALEEETQEKITDIQRKAEQKREDIERAFNRDFEDNFRSTQEKITELLSEEGVGGGDIRDFLSGFEGDIRSRLSDSGRSQLRNIEGQRLETDIDSRRERGRDLEDVGIQEGRQIEETRLQQARERIAMDAQLLQQQSELNTSMHALTSELSGISATETVVAAAASATTAAETAASHAVVSTENVGMGIEAANTAASTLDGIVQQELQIVETISGVSDTFVRAAAYLSQTEALPRLADAVRDLPEKLGAVLSERLAAPLISALGNLKGPVGAPERIGIVPMGGFPVGGPEGDNRLFHFDQTDAIAHRLARSAALNRPRAAPAYLPDSNQIRNARDVSKEIVAGLTEGLSQRKSGFGNVGASQQSGLPEEITANITIEFPDGTVQEIRDQMLRLSAQDR